MRFLEADCKLERLVSTGVAVSPHFPAGKPKHFGKSARHKPIARFVMLRLFPRSFVVVVAIYLDNDYERRRFIVFVDPSANSKIRTVTTVLRLSEKNKKPAWPTAYFPVVVIRLAPLELC